VGLSRWPLGGGRVQRSDVGLGPIQCIDDLVRGVIALNDHGAISAQRYRLVPRVATERALGRVGVEGRHSAAQADKGF
jgi:hypothetical protein